MITLPAYQTPGVYRLPRRSDQRDVRLVRTDVAGFVGYAERGPLYAGSDPPADAAKYAVRLTSWEEYRAVFGGLTPYGHLAFAIRGFFENGGTTCHVVRVAAVDHATPQQRPATASADVGGVTVRATSAGSWGNRIRLRLTPLTTGATAIDFALRVTVQRIDLTQPIEEEFYRHVSTDSKSPVYLRTVLQKRSQILTSDLDDRGATVRTGALHRTIALAGGADGLVGVSVEDFIGSLARFRGARLLEEIRQVSILCAPDAMLDSPVAWSMPAPVEGPCDPPRRDEALPPPDPTGIPPSFGDNERARIYSELIAQCERRRDRVAILDTLPPAGAAMKSQQRGGAPDMSGDQARALKWRTPFTSRFAALYYPWLKVSDPLQRSGFRLVPPCGHVAGVYARTDAEFGVQKPPANAVLDGAVDVADPVTAIEQERLNPFGVNVLRSFPGRGIRVWGARSLAAPDDAAWRFIHARRLMSMIEESVDYSTQWTVFEPNDENLRRTLVHSLSMFLQTIWQQGGLEGASPREAYFVKCDETNNPRQVIDQGQVVCQVGVAVAAPMEFLVFEIRQTPDGASTVEA